MFTGIITEIGRIRKIEKTDKYSISIQVEEGFLEDVKVNDSIAHNGICLTVVEKSNDIYMVQAMNETINLTNIKFWKEGSLVNLEKAMIMGQRLDGHMVQGHVDSVAVIDTIQKDGDSYIYELKTEHLMTEKMVKKGSVALDGVSLTLVDVACDRFSVAIIPHTRKQTIFKDYKVGDNVNVEVDIIAKYIYKYSKS